LPGSDPEEVEFIRIREVWTEANKIRVSLEKPWYNTTDTSIKYRVVSDEYTFPDDLMELKSASIFEDGSTYPRPLEVAGQAVAEYGAYPHNSEFASAGVPRIMTGSGQSPPASLNISSPTCGASRKSGATRPARRRRR
jgi:hypothetical protein